MLMWELVLLQLIVKCLALEIVKPNLYIIGMYENAEYRNCVETAFEDIKQRKDILPLYNLSLISIETKNCDVGLSNKELFKLLYTPPTKIMIVGNGCSDVCLQTGQYVPYFNLVQISYKATATELRNKTKYPTFFRTLHSNTGFIHTRLLLMREFGWKRVANIIIESPLNTQLTSGFQTALRNSNDSLILNEEFFLNSELPLLFKKLKAHHGRIIFASFIDKKDAFCQIYKHNLYGPQYVWIISTFVKDWWNISADIPCEIEEYLQALEGSFHMMYDRIIYSKEESLSTKDSTMLIYNDEFYGAAYDAMWAAALALNTSSIELKNSGRRLEDFTYNNSDIGNIILRNMQNVNFKGISEHISFDEQGDVKEKYIIHRFIDGKPEIVGYSSEESSKIEWTGNIIWRNGKPPLDQPEILFRKTGLSTGVYATVCFLTSLAILLTLLFIIFNRFLHMSRIAVTSSNLDLLFLIGGFFILISLFVESSQDIEQINCCIAFRFLFYIGFSLGIGALFTKIWRIHMISINAQVLLPDQRLFLIIAIYLTLNMLVLIIRESSDPSSINLHNKTIENSDDSITIIQTGICDSSKGVYYRAVLCFIQGFMLLFSSYLSWETRKASFPGLRDSRIIGMCVYNILVLSIIGVGIAVVVDNATMDYVVKVACILIGVTSTQCIIFITKIRHYRSGKLEQDDNDNPEIIKNNTTSPSPNSAYPPQSNTNTIEATVASGIDEISKVIEERNKVIAKMSLRLENQQTNS